ncbi:hypothetical protein DDV21_005435 [Streptococcus chenjunshii]|uniref:Uncharacterized protein n=1 Tax=Streptococcus chenjunshii TaxID=2173853 RepID=A0A372KPH4_9STRE|nr:hypothetical protein [Streptococcus chenjunshii]AXQ78561.1 hypothetical protein DDV21_005435 [Streptococcus chenjunshii]RFU51977.1 hypothetical protein DDV22_00610 [Streptococcus chenjunshii]RFU54169.1 hypothetical protein DDV23_01165 [Streptococcus chenjunshii]
MKSLTQKLKMLNKTGFKLSFICGLNWLIKFLIPGQHYFFAAFFLGLLTYYMPHDIQQLSVFMLGFLVIITVVTNLLFWILYSKDLYHIKFAFYVAISFCFFQAGNNYIGQHALTDYLVSRLLTLWMISFIIATFASHLQFKLFKQYLFKNVINKEYLGIRKLTADLPPESNFYTDADEMDANKRMKLINQNAIKKPYQGVVELSFLNRKVTTGIHYKTDLITKEVERIFEDVDTIYYPVFRVYPFGIEEDFGYTLIQLKLSSKAAFTEYSS